MKFVQTLLLTVGSAAALDRLFAFHNAMCDKSSGQQWDAFFQVNNVAENGQGGYDPNSIEGQLATQDPQEYDLSCIRFCLAKLDPTKQNHCCGYHLNFMNSNYLGAEGQLSCWLTSGDSISFNSGFGKAIMIGEREEHRQLYNFTMGGVVDLGFTEQTSSTGVNDTLTEIEIAVYPDGVTKTLLHSEVNVNSQIAPRDYMPIEESFYLLPTNGNARAEINLKGNFNTELTGATEAQYSTSDIDRFGTGYGMFGFSGNSPVDANDLMLIYDVRPLPNVEPIFAEEEFDALLMEHCSIWIFSLGFWCRF